MVKSAIMCEFGVIHYRNFYKYTLSIINVCFQFRFCSVYLSSLFIKTLWLPLPIVALNAYLGKRDLLKHSFLKFFLFQSIVVIKVWFMKMQSVYLFWKIKVTREITGKHFSYNFLHLVQPFARILQFLEKNPLFRHFLLTF